MKPVRVDISMSLMMDATSYTKVGSVLDALHIAGQKALQDNNVERGIFDIRHVNTHPCKDIAMSGMVQPHYDLQPQPSENNGLYMPELPLVVED